MRDRTAIHVHWARDAAEHNQIVHAILRDHGATSLIKSKSMLTEECGFRPYMASVGVEVIETDLGERIQQLDHEDPSHVVVPAVHKLAHRRGGGIRAARSGPTPAIATSTIWRRRSGRRPVR